MTTLWHGTTRQRAEAILRGGPDPNYREPKSYDRVEGFSAARPVGPYPQGDPTVIAYGKAAQCSDEGGPVILEFEVPEEIAAMADLGDEYRFFPGFGLEELRLLWPQLPKRLIDLP